MIDPNAQDADSGEFHTGYDLESGLLARFREWTDLFPWLRLGRTLRVAGSPLMVGLVALTFILWWSVQVWIVQQMPEAAGFGYRNAPPIVESLLAYTSQWIPISAFSWDQGEIDFVTASAVIVWGLLVWTPIVLYLLRQGALLTAGRELVGLELGLRRAIRLTPIGWLIALVPLACVLVFGLMILVAGWLARLIAGISFLEAPLALLVVIIAIPAGLLGFGAYIAIPLGWAALANEKDPDALDALSRGYEYLYRRPLKVAWYAFLSTLILLIITAITASIAEVASWVVIAVLGAAGTEAGFADRVIGMLAFYPLVVGMALFWALVGGVYLLLRYDAGQQEIEDLWQPSPKPEPPLPQLPQSVGAER